MNINKKWMEILPIFATFSEGKEWSGIWGQMEALEWRRIMKYSKNIRTERYFSSWLILLSDVAILSEHWILSEYSIIGI